MTADFRRGGNTTAAQMEHILRDSDEDSNDGGFDQSLLQPTEKTPDDRPPAKQHIKINAKEQLSHLLREQKVLQEANRLQSNTDQFKRGPSGLIIGTNAADNIVDRNSNQPAAQQRGRTKSPIGAAGLNQTLSKFKSIDLNLIQALGNRRQNSQTGLNRSVSANVLPDKANEANDNGANNNFNVTDVKHNHDAMLAQSNSNNALQHASQVSSIHNASQVPPTSVQNPLATTKYVDKVSEQLK